MKKLCLLVSILPLFGCNNADETVSKHQDKQNYTEIYEQVPKPRIQKTVNTKMENNLEEKQPISKANVNQQVTQPAKKNSMMLDVVLIKQNPELRYGCEVTSLAMVLNFAGVKTDKMDLYRSIQKDPDPIKRSANGDILNWGNPADGFVGDMTGKKAGYAVFDKPMEALVNQKLPGRAVNLTNQPFERILEHVSAGYPVVVWTTGDYRLPDRWESWYHGQQVIKTPLDLHAVVLVGYDANFVYLNDPLSGGKQVRVGKDRFISSWKALQSRAISYK
ncbi:C39 family peptidase [Neobacillus niacini]|uniref:C39 family peptidase n=1 Tax=Neobacillus niacini TaxID=86668 RepID=UPI0039838177